MTSTIGMVGAGAVAHALVAALTRTGPPTALKVWARRPAAAASVAALGGERAEPVPSLAGLQDCDAILIAISDSALPEVAEALRASLPDRAEPRQFFHTSGALTGRDALAPLGAAAHPLGSLHPLVAVAKDRLPAPDVFVGMPFAIESTHVEATGLAGQWVQRMGGFEVELPPCATPEAAREQKLRYHALATMVASGVVTLVDRAAAAMAGAEGPDSETRTRFRQAYGELARSAVQNVLRANGDRVLTGAIARGDDALVTEHVASLRGTEPEALYRAVEVAARQMLRGPSTPSAPGDAGSHP